MGKDFERAAERLYGAAGLDPERGAAPSELVRALLGADAIRFVKGEWLDGGATLARVGASWRIYLRAGLRPEHARFRLLHELAHFVEAGASESECDRLAAALLAPRRAFQRALIQSGNNCTKLARWFICSESLVALRLGEVVGAPIALVAPSSVRVRGPWPLSMDPKTVRELASKSGPGLCKVRLRDDPMRILLHANS
jgi:hypothetical protein